MLTNDELETAARVWLTERGLCGETLSHRAISKYGRVAHLFKTRLRGKTLRFVAVLSEDAGSILRLDAIGSCERKRIGKTGISDVGELRAHTAKNTEQVKVHKEASISERHRQEVSDKSVIDRLNAALLGHRPAAEPRRIPVKDRSSGVVIVRRKAMSVKEDPNLSS